MNQDYKVIYCDKVSLAVELVDGGYFNFGTLIFTLQSDGRRVYIIEIDENRYDEALTLADEEMFPGFDVNNGWCQRHDKEIPFVYERTYDPKREDLDDMLRPWGMVPEKYSRWELLKITKGLHRDKWRILPYDQK